MTGRASRSGKGARAWLLAIALAACPLPGAAAAPAFTPPEGITVVTDINYPPYLFQTEDGRLQGIIKDKWDLWSARTGVAVQMKGMEWAAAQQAVRSGANDVIEALTFSPERATLYDFSAPYAAVEARVYFHRTVGGISNDVATLRGFEIGAKSGSACASWLARAGIASDLFHWYSSSEDLVKAAGAGDVRLFCMDAAAARYFLFKLRLADEFRESPALYTSQFHWAVRKGRSELRDFIQSGFDRIKPEELQTIEESWLGSPLRLPIAPRYWYYLALALAAILAAASLLLVINWSLRRRVAARTRELEAERTLLKSLVDNLPEHVFSMDAQGRYTMANPAWLAGSGFATQDEVLGKTVHDLFPADLAGRAEAENRGIAETGVGVYDASVEVKAPDGSLRWLLLTKVPLFDGEGRYAGLIGVRRDVTRLKQAADELARERNLLRSIIDHAPDLIVAKDLDLRYVLMNRKGADLRGTTPEAVIGRTSREFLASRAADMNETEDREVLRTGNPIISLQRESLLPSGDMRWISVSKVPLRDADGRVSGLLSIVRDTTPLKTATDALARERNLLRSIIDNSPVEIFLKDLDLRYVLMNDRALRLVGAAGVEDIKGKSAHDFFPADGARSIEREEREVIRSGQALVVAQRRRAADPLRWHSVNKVPLRDAEGSVTGLLILNQDITELRNAIEEARRLNVELEERVRLRTGELEEAVKELKAFSYSVSHDLRAPLRRVSGFLSMLRRSSEERLTAAERGMVQRIVAAAQRMDHLIDDMLRLSRVAGQEIHVGEVDLSRLASQIAAELSGADPGRTVTMQIAENMQVRADASLVRIVLENLMGNAWKFTGKTSAPAIEVGVTIKEAGPVYHVRDNGAGFDMQYAQRLFGPFQRLHHTDEFPGTGVGLATVARIVRRHGGRIWAEARPDQGATFYFTFGGGPADLPSTQAA